MKPPTADLDTDKKPPLSLPFAHFVAGAVLLLVGGGLAGVGPYFLPIQASSAGTLHLLLAGWVGLTIMGSMVLFVPVWSGTRLHSRRLSVASLWLVFLGVAGTVTIFFDGAYRWFPVTTTVLIAGYWTFAYTIARSLPPIRTLDITEAHFLAALTNLVLATTLGWLLAADIGVRFLGGLAIDPTAFLLSHLTLTVFGFVGLTIVGALYQLGPMFTQSEPTAIDAHLAHVEMVALPGGVLVLAAGRLFDALLFARVGAIAVLLGVAAFAVILLRRLWTATVDTGPMLSRYGLVGASALGWVVLTFPGWLADPLSYSLRFGSPRATHLLFVGVITFTVVGTFYHVVPFVIWLQEYSDLLGYEPVPAIDDLFDHRIARLEFWLLAIGLATLWVGELVSTPTWVLMVGGNVLGAGVLLFALNMALVVYRHRPETTREVIDVLASREISE